MFRQCLSYLNHISLKQVMGIVHAKQAGDPLNKATMLVDVRSTAEVAQTGMIPTAVNIPLSILPDVLDYDSKDLTDNDFEETYGIKRPVKGDSVLIFYCAHGIRSARATEIAEQLGFSGALNFSGSWAEWSGAFKADSGTKNRPEPMSQSSYKAQFEYTLSYDEIEAIVRAKKNGNATEVIILDVRDAYERKSNGHIPYSINIPIPEIRDLQKMSNSAFAKKYGVGKPKKTDPIVIYCNKRQRSTFVHELLKNDGYKVVTYVREGFEGWQKHQNAQLDDDL